MSEAADSRIPVTVLTGYLGAGKTTLLNRILSENHGTRYAVIVNEFGEIGIDNDLLVETDEEVYEMNNGCICCTVRGDLIRTVENLMKRKGAFDAIIIETTGVADPAPVAQTFFMDDDVHDAARLDAVVAVVDTRHVRQRLKDTTEAEDQIAFSDVILLNKTDLASAEELAGVEAAIRRINPYAKIHHTERCQVAISDVLDRGAFELERILDIDPEFLKKSESVQDHECGLDHDHHNGHAHKHDHDHPDHECGPDCNHDHEDTHSVKSYSFTAGDLDPKIFFDWINQITQIQGPNILRMKGILSLRDDPQRYVLQGIHMNVEGDHQRDWRDDEKRESRIVFIGRELDGAALKTAFEACVAE